ncbi:MAG: 50S ribosomal protein L7ae [Nitrosopumilales archaeon]|nr:MAG: 50S ribosomal protein L7ae [Nitrosopumilales archaeon]
MNKLLEKSLKTGIKENNCTVGSKQVLGSLKNSKLLVISESTKKNIFENIQSNAKKAKVPTVEFKGSSIELGKLCGVPFRVSIVSLNTISDSNIKSILKEDVTK